MSISELRKTSSSVSRLLSADTKNGSAVVDFGFQQAKRRKRSVLLVDDDNDQLVLFKYLLERGDYAVSCAQNPYEALSLLETSSFDVLVCDLRMPQLDGRDLVRRVRSVTPGGAFVPVVMITAGSKDLELEAIAAGADLFCTKKRASKILIPQLNLLLA